MMGRNVDYVGCVSTSKSYEYEREYRGVIGTVHNPHNTHERVDTPQPWLSGAQGTAQKEKGTEFISRARTNKPVAVVVNTLTHSLVAEVKHSAFVEALRLRQCTWTRELARRVENLGRVLIEWASGDSDHGAILRGTGWERGAPRARGLCPLCRASHRRPLFGKPQRIARSR